LPILPFKEVNNSRSFLYVGNFVIYVDRIIEKQASGLFLLTDEYPLSTEELVLEIAASLNKRVYLVKAPAFLLRIGKRFFPGLVERLFSSLAFDNTQTRQILGPLSLISPSKGIANMINYYLHNNTKS